MKTIDIKAVVTLLTTQEDLNDPNAIRKIHKNVPRKFMTSSILDTAVNEDKAFVTMDLKQAPMVSIDEMKAYLEMKGDNARLKSFIKWLEKLEESYDKE